MSNPFLDKIESIVEKTLERDAPSILEKLLGEKVEQLVDQLVPVVVAQQLHKALEAEPTGGGADWWSQETRASS